MLNPWQFAPGIVFDTRSIVLSLAGLFFGLIPTAIAAVMTSLFRIYQGGAGAWTGVAVIVTSAGLGVAWRHLRPRWRHKLDWQELYLFGVVVHVAMLLCMLSLSGPVAMTVLSIIALPVMLVYPIGTVLLGLLLARQHSRRQILQTLQQSEAQYRRIVETAEEGIRVIDADDRVIFANQKLADILGYTIDEMLGARLFDFMDEEEAQLAQARLANRRQGIREQYDFKSRHKDGHAVWTHMSTSPILDEAGQYAGVLAMITDITERVQAEKSLRESEDRYRDLVEHSHDLICTHDLEGNLISVNSAASRLSGYSEDELTQMNLRDILPPEVRWQFKGYLAEIQAKSRASGLMLIQTKSGDRRIWEYNNTLRTEGVTVPLVRGMAHDITQRKQAEQALKASEERFALAIQGSNDGLWDWDIRSKTLYWSPRLKELLGYADDELKIDFDTFDLFLHPDDRERVASAIEAHLKERKPYDVEERQRTKSGEYRWYRARGQALWDESGNPVRMVGFTSDITERKQAEESARYAEQRYRALFEDAPVIYVITRAVEDVPVIVECNGLFRRTLGFSRDEVLGRPLADFYSPASRRQLLEGGDYRRALTGEFAHEERELLTRDGRIVPGMVRALPEVDAAGQVSGTRAMFLDITEHKQAERQAFELALERERMSILTKFIQDASHEFRTPLAIMQANLYVLNKTDNPDKRREKTAQIEDQVAHITRLIEMLVSIARLESGITFTRQPVDLNDLLRELAAQMQGAVENKHLALHLALTPDLPPIQADPGQLREALRQIVDNAVRYTPAEGTIILRTAGKADDVTVEIQNTGPGIPTDVLPRIFDRFYRLDVAHSTPGFGLGLPIARAIVERHGGHIAAESQPGAGSAFRVTLPLEGIPVRSDRPGQISVPAMDQPNQGVAPAWTDGPSAPRP